MNRRIWIRTYGGVRGRESSDSLLLDACIAKKLSQRGGFILSLKKLGDWLKS